MQKGFIKLHRRMTDWEWYDDPNTMRLFIHCLLRANHQDNNWRGILVKRGTFLTSLETLSKEMKLSISQIRTSIKKLEKTNEIASLSQARSRVITIVEYDAYQANDKVNGKVVTSSSQDSDRVVTTNKTVKTVKTVKKKDLVIVSELDFSSLKMTKFEVEEFIRIQKKNNDKKNKLTQRVIKGLSKQFELARTDHRYTNDDILTEWEGRGWKSFKSQWVQTSFPNQQMQPKANEDSTEWALKALNGKDGIMF